MQHFRDSVSGELLYRRRAYDAQHLDELLAERQRDAYRYVQLLLAAILLPVCGANLYSAQFLPALAALILLGVLSVNIWLLSTSREALMPPALVLLLSMFLVLLLVFIGQEHSLYWLYPLLVALPVLLRTSWSIWLGMLCGAVVAPLAYIQFETGMAVVICTSMGLTWLVSAWLVFAVSEQSRRLRDMAVTDSLTGAYNRRFLEQRAEEALRDWRRSRHPATLLLVDIDHFKGINDRFGHTAGDTALRGLVEVISGRIRSVDTLCRFGGEEFAVLLQQTGARDAMRVADELRERVAATPLLPEGYMTISVGASDVAGTESLDHWFRLADGALYLAKRNGRNRCELANPGAPIPAPIPRSVPDWR